MARRRSGPVRHVFVHMNPPDVDAKGLEWCAQCALPSTNSIHDVPQRSEDERDHEARRLGEEVD